MYSKYILNYVCNLCFMSLIYLNFVNGENEPKEDEAVYTNPSPVSTWKKCSICVDSTFNFFRKLVCLVLQI